PKCGKIQPFRKSSAAAGLAPMALALEQHVSWSGFAEHEGRIVKRTGNGLLVEFPARWPAQRIFQRKMRERNADVASPRCHLKWYLEGRDKGRMSLVAVQRLTENKGGKTCRPKSCKST